MESNGDLPGSLNTNSHLKQEWSHVDMTTTKTAVKNGQLPVGESTPAGELRRAGLGLVVFSMGIYGLRMEPRSRFNRLLTAWIILVGLFGLVSVALMMVAQLAAGDTGGIEFWCMYMVIGFFGLKAPVMYVHACILFRKYAIFLVHLARTVNAIESDRLGAACKTTPRRIARMTTFAMILATGITIGAAISSVMCFPVKQEQLPDQFRFYIFGHNATLLLMKANLACWFLFANSFTYVCTAMLIIICKVINTCFDSLIPENRRDTFDKNYLLPTAKKSDLHHQEALPSSITELSIGYRQTWHERLCMLVAEANHLFAPFMLLSLGGEITVLMLYSQSSNVLNWLHGLVLSVLQSIMFLLTTINCAKVNEKVVSALLLAPQHGLEEVRSYSGEHINYMLYASQLAVQNVTLTYGKFFPIRYSFIFTIAGTTLTYTLLFKDII